MIVEPIKTERVELGADLFAFLEKYLPQKDLLEGSVLAVTSKIISFCEGRAVDKSTVSKEELVAENAQAVLVSPKNQYNITLTIKEDQLMASAGIDESNAGPYYVLLPKNSQASASAIWTFLKNRYGLKNFGVIVTDSRTYPLRLGVTGVCLGWCGFKPLYSYVGKPDLYGRKMTVTRTNLLDCLATSAVLVMGEGAESTPLAIVSNLSKISFQERPPTLEQVYALRISISEDLYAPLLLAGNWEQSGRDPLFR